MAREQEDNWKMARVELGVLQLFRRGIMLAWLRVVVAEVEKKRWIGGILGK